MGNGERGTGNGERGTGNGERGNYIAAAIFSNYKQSLPLNKQIEPPALDTPEERHRVHHQAVLFLSKNLSANHPLR